MKTKILGGLIFILFAQSASAQTLYFRAPLLGATSANSIGQPDTEEDESEENQTCYDISHLPPDFGEEPSGFQGFPIGPDVFVVRYEFKPSLTDEEKETIYQEEFPSLNSMFNLDYSQYTYEDFPLYVILIEDEDTRGTPALVSTESELASYGVTNLRDFIFFESYEENNFLTYEANRMKYCRDDSGVGNGDNNETPSEGEGEIATIESFNTTPISFIQEGNCHYDIEVNTSGDANKLEVIFQSDYNSTEQSYSIDLPSQAGGVFSVLTGNIFNANVSDLVQPDAIVDFGGNYSIVLNLYNSSNSIMDTKTIENFEAPEYLGESELFYDEDDDYYLEISYDEGRRWLSTGRGFHPSSSAFQFSENPNVQTENLMDEYSFNYDGSQTIISELFPYIATDQNYPMTVEKYEYSVAKMCYLFL